MRKVSYFNMKRNMPHRTALLVGGALLAMVTLPLDAAAKFSKTGTSLAGFKALGPGGLNIDGKTSDVELTDDGTTVTIAVKLANIDTGVTVRNKHTKEDMEEGKFPTATLKVSRSALKVGGGEGDAKGSLTIHGQTRDVTFHYSISNQGGTFSIKGNLKINVGDFGVKPRSYLGVAIKPDVDIYANFQATDSP